MKQAALKVAKGPTNEDKLIVVVCLIAVSSIQLPGATVVGILGRIVADHHEPLLDLEHGKLPDPVTEALKLLIEEQDKLKKRVSQLETSSEPVVTAGGPEKQERGLNE